jgi:predicted amidohydrolase
MPPSPCRLAVVQHPPVFLNLTGSVERAVGLIRDALAHGAQCIVFPETWLPGYPVWLDEAPTAGLWDYPPAQALYQVLSDNAITVPGPELDTLRATAATACIARSCRPTRNDSSGAWATDRPSRRSRRRSALSAA